jgi:hypothetical protein
MVHHQQSKRPAPRAERNPMTKKQDALSKQQSRDKNPDKMMAGSAAGVQEGVSRKLPKKASASDSQQPQSPKLANDHNKVGETKPTQKNQGRRTPQSRHDRETVNGGMNVTQARTGGKGGGRGTRGGNVGGKPT